MIVVPYFSNDGKVLSGGTGWCRGVAGDWPTLLSGYGHGARGQNNYELDVAFYEPIDTKVRLFWYYILPLAWYRNIIQHSILPVVLVFYFLVQLYNTSLIFLSPQASSHKILDRYVEFAIAKKEDKRKWLFLFVWLMNIISNKIFAKVLVLCTIKLSCCGAVSETAVRISYAGKISICFTAPFAIRSQCLVVTFDFILTHFYCFLKWHP